MNGLCLKYCKARLIRGGSGEEKKEHAFKAHRASRARAR